MAVLDAGTHEEPPKTGAARFEEFRTGNPRDRGVMAELLRARTPIDTTEERQLRKLASARHMPCNSVQRAKIIAASWSGQAVENIAMDLDCHTRTVRRWIHRFNKYGIAGLEDHTRTGRRPRLTQTEQKKIVALPETTPPTWLVQKICGGATDTPVRSQWTLDMLTEAALAEGVIVGRSQLRRILLAAGVQWRDSRSPCAR